MTKRDKPEKQVRLNDGNHEALRAITANAITKVSISSLVNAAVELALPQIRERFCRSTTAK